MTQVISGARRAFLYAITGCQCTYCGRTMVAGANAKVDPEAATLDHIIPVCDGGDNSYDNLAPACAECNNRKGILPLLDFLETLPREQRKGAHGRLGRLAAGTARARNLDRARRGQAFFGWRRQIARAA